MLLSDSDLKERLGRILQSDYFTTPPELQTLNATAEISRDGGEAQRTSDSTAETQQVRLMQKSHARNVGLEVLFWSVLIGAGSVSEYNVSPCTLFYDISALRV
jgi:hypothetical protein